MKSRIKIPDSFRELFTPSRYKVYHGGRGSGKSWSVAAALLILSLRQPLRILCTRELQKSIGDSVHKLLCDLISTHGLDQYFDIIKTSIKSRNGSEFLFAGLRSNVAEIKSMEGIDICWVEEAQRMSEESWQILIPTIRKDNSEIWITFNPVDNDDSTYQRFVVSPPLDSIVRRVLWNDNPYFPEPLKKEMEHDRKKDHAMYLHLWEGETRRISGAVIFAGRYVVDRFTAPDDALFHYGADWGFSQDPTTLIRCFVLDKVLYIDYEAYGVGVDIDDTPSMFDAVPGSRKWEIIGDSSRPETISYMNKSGYRVRGSKKGAGSVEDGIEFIKSFDSIVVHERCARTIHELGSYSYKVNAASGQITPLIEDRNNHCIDALRYALEPLMRSKPLFIGRV